MEEKHVEQELQLPFNIKNKTYKMIRAVLVDDEPDNIEILQEKLEEQYSDKIEILDTANSSKEAIAAINKHQPDILFLDISMPGGDGFDLLRKLPTFNFVVIFVTAFDSYAIEAFEFSAVGYVLKPIRDIDLEKAIENAEKKIQAKRMAESNQQMLDNLGSDISKHKIAIPITEGLEFVPVYSIIYCEGAKGCTKIYYENNEKIISSYNIGKYVTQLGKYKFFFQTHKSYYVNLYHVKRYLNIGTGIMSNSDHIPVARRKRPEFIERLKELNR